MRPTDDEPRLASVTPRPEGGYVMDTPHGPATLTPDLLDDLATFYQVTPEEALLRLRAYRYGRMASEWAEARPVGAAAQRAFYGATDAYNWSLLIWKAAGKYTFYDGIVDQMARLQGAERAAEAGRPLRALDYGSGVGTSAIRLGARGYQVSIADVPGPTFAFAQHRLARHLDGRPFVSIPITSDAPHLADRPSKTSAPGMEEWDTRFDAIVCFDVLEHVEQPGQVFDRLVAALTPGGLISVIAPFDAQEDYGGQDGGEGYHLRANYLRYGEGRWNLFLSGRGFTPVGGGDAGAFIWRRTRGPAYWARRCHYTLWRATGLDVRYKRPTIKDTHKVK